MDNGQSVPSLNDVDSVLRKYAKVWIWSVLITISAGLLYRVSANYGMWISNTQNSGSRPDIYLRISAVATAIGAIAVFLALYWLLKFLSDELLPIFFAYDPPSRAAGSGELLVRAFGALVVGSGVEAASYLVLLFTRILT